MIISQKLTANTLRILRKIELTELDFASLMRDLQTKYPAELEVGQAYQCPVTNIIFARVPGGWQRIAVRL